ncbi:hypothetical protein M5K25_012469 [Dendrobium thyrsiflorum]|uniref:Lipocalin/cytosolic fatty-acid binding domain-containing protein n=1 Tax=Dendrobium thyrsiflorum TaxID=117978 RepID=A0ABD0V4E7_DENTH
MSSSPIENGNNLESMQVLRGAVMPLAIRSVDGFPSNAYHWVDGSHLNLHLYHVLLETCFDHEEGSIINEKFESNLFVQTALIDMYASQLVARLTYKMFEDLLKRNVVVDDISLWNAILQGASSGIGTKTARMLALRGVHVILVVRNIFVDNNVKEMILKEIPIAKVNALELDLRSMAFASEIATNFNFLNLPLNILINNLGVGMSSFMLSQDSIEMNFVTNHIGHFLLTNLLLKNMKVTASKGGMEERIVIAASEAYKFSYRQGIGFDKINEKFEFNGFAAYGLEDDSFVHNSLLWSNAKLRRKCSKKGKRSFRCSVQETACNNDDVSRNLFSGFAASIMFLSLPNQVAALELSGPQNFFQLANALDSSALFKGDESQDQGSQMMMMMMRGMTVKNFDPVRYSGRWFEVASLKRGFAGQGQEDCHCTQGVYSFDAETLSIQVDTFCVHGGPDGYITGIRGKVQCLSLENMEKAETDLEMKEIIKEKCFLRFPTLPFIPKEPYDVIATDYDNFSLVSGAKDKSFVQIYSRRPDPGPAFISKYKSYLADLGYDPNKIKDTPQDCQVMSSAQLALMMSRTGMKEALTNQFPDLELKAPIAINPFTSIFDTLKKLLQLYFK